MAELKSGTTIGGAQVWTQGNFPLFPTGNTLVYKTFKIYSENDKPKAIDNDFVSKADGGTYAKNVSFPSIGVAVNPNGSDGRGLNLYGAPQLTGEPTYGIHFSLQSAFGSHGPSALWSTYFRHASSYPWIFRSGATNVASISGAGVFQGPQVVLQNPPTEVAHATRKDYVDTLNTNTNNEVNKRVLRSGDTMTGLLTAPNFISNNAASLPGHLTRFDQVVPKGAVIDFATY